FPSLHHRKEGQAASSKKCCEATEGDAAGVVFLLFSIGKPPRLRDQRRLRTILLIARPPLLTVMQGGEYARFQIHSQLHRPRYTGTEHVFISSFASLCIPRTYNLIHVCAHHLRTSLNGMFR